MIHSIISWDCCFRNFFHLIGSLAEQNFSRDQYEFIYVEQKSKQQSDAFNHANGLPSLGDVVKKYANRYNVKVEYLNQPEDHPYHLGIANNHGLSIAKGEIISVMDGDVLVKKDFLQKLQRCHESCASVYNLYRHMAKYPVGVRYLHQWKEGIINFDKCLDACDTKGASIPVTYANKGPLISARRVYWEQTDGYDPHILFSTSASIAGGDMCARLELAIGAESLALPNQCCVHPWHPIGYARKHRPQANHAVNRYLDLQRMVYKKSINEKHIKWSARQNYLDALYEANRELVETVIEADKRAAII